MRRTQWTPGSGTYLTSRDLPTPGKPGAHKEFDPTKTRMQRAPNFSFGRSTKETTFTLPNLKVQPNHGTYPKKSNYFTPGPGTHVQPNHGTYPKKSNYFTPG